MSPEEKAGEGGFRRGEPGARDALEKMAEKSRLWGSRETTGIQR